MATVEMRGYASLCDECGYAKTECRCAGEPVTAHRRGALLIQRDDYLCREEQERIATLERDNSLLLRYVRADEAIKREANAHRGFDFFEVSDAQWMELFDERTAAYHALIESGLLEGGDDDR